MDCDATGSLGEVVCNGFGFQGLQGHEHSSHQICKRNFEHAYNCRVRFENEQVLNLLDSSSDYGFNSFHYCNMGYMGHGVKLAKK